MTTRCSSAARSASAHGAAGLRDCSLRRLCTRASRPRQLPRRTLWLVKRSSLADRQWGPGSRHVFRSSLYHLKPLFAVTSRPPVAPASATTSIDGRDRCIPFPADRQGHADAQPGARRPARSPSGLGSGIAKSCHPWGQGGNHGWRSPVTNSAATDEAAHRVSVAIQLTAASARSPHQPIGAAGSPRHPNNGGTCHSAKGPIGRFRGSAKAPSERSADQPGPALAVAPEARHRPTFLVSVARPRGPLLSECSSLRMLGGRVGRGPRTDDGSVV